MMELEGSTNTPIGLCHLACLWICFRIAFCRDGINPYVSFFWWDNDIVPVRQCCLPPLKIHSEWKVGEAGRQDGVWGFFLNISAKQMRNKQGVR